MVKNNKQIGIIGHFGGNEDFFDGQTIKTRILYEEIRKSTDWKISTVDTYEKSQKPLKLFIDTIKCLIQSDDVIVLLSKNGMRFCFPLLSFWTRTFHVNIYHDVIGGNLDTYVQKYPQFKKYLNSFRLNWVETNKLKESLQKVGVSNCVVIPNFKRLKLEEVQYKEYKEPYRFCTFSRVTKEKGIEDAVKAVQEINHEMGRTFCSLDIYGSVDERYREQFTKLINNPYLKNVYYKGVIPYNKSVETIRNYYALLFPTFWDGEGFPGTIIDAFSAGVPVIGTDWNSNAEIIENEKNGILYPNAENNDLKSSIKWLINNKDKMPYIKENCILSAQKYQPDLYIKKMIDTINNS